ncbi:MAG: methane monooxygenase/ammonia monooxygenase subunit B, partial [Gammaproteobacteria bacterium]
MFFKVTIALSRSRSWSHTNMKVNDEVILSGRFHVAEDWPNAVAKPDSAFLNLAMPTP